jgi:hypothetical protein
MVLQFATSRSSNGLRSDIDLALMRLAARVDDRIEARAFMPEDFNAGDPLASEIRRTGVQVA